MGEGADEIVAEGLEEAGQGPGVVALGVQLGGDHVAQEPGPLGQFLGQCLWRCDRWERELEEHAQQVVELVGVFEGWRLAEFERGGATDLRLRDEFAAIEARIQEKSGAG